MSGCLTDLFAQNDRKCAALAVCAPAEIIRECHASHGRDGLRAVPIFSFLYGPIISRTTRRPSLPKNEHRLIPKRTRQVGSHLRGDRLAMGGFGAPVRSEIG